MELFLCGDAMTGRGIDQVLPRPGDPVLYERWARSARDYVALAERVNGPIPRGVGLDWIWGDALGDMLRADLRVINLETAVTTSGAPEPKGINYRMHPDNVGCLTAARVDCCVLANNHVLDWGPPGLLDTLDTLHAVGLATAGAGRDRAEADAPAALPAPGGRVLVYGLGHRSSGIPPAWAAGDSSPGVAMVSDLSPAAAGAVSARIARHRRAGDLVVASIHWGGNWGWRIPWAHRAFARALVDSGVVDVVHGHSSHHPLGLEVYRGRLILYGCGDFVNDYEGITGYEEYRPELALGYLLRFDLPSVRLERLELVPMRIRRFRLERACRGEAEWLARVLDRHSVGAEVSLGDDGRLTVTPPVAPHAGA